MNYVPRGYGLALTIREDSGVDAGCIETERSTSDNCSVEDIDLDESEGSVSHFDNDGADDGYLTVIESGVTTLELRRPGGESSYLIWDESEVEWDSLRAG